MASKTVKIEPEQAIKLIRDLDFQLEENPCNKYEKLRFVVRDGERKTTIIGYEGKVLIQGNDNTTSFNRISDLLKSNEIKIETKELPDKEIHIGIDETGKGEPIGSLFQCGVVLSKDDLVFFKDKVKDSKRMTDTQINYIFGLVKKRKINYIISETNARNICEYPYGLNNLMDMKNIMIISQCIKSQEPNKCLLIIDNYSPSQRIKDYLSKIKTSFSSVFIENADAKYTCVMLASIIAKKYRNDEIESLSKANVIQISEAKCTTFTKNYESIMIWIEEFLKKYPEFGLPHFVKTTWKDIEKLLKKYPRKRTNLFFDCPYCKEKISIIYLVRESCILHCSNCYKEIDVSNFVDNISNILPDSSALVCRVFSKLFYSDNRHIITRKNIIIPHSIETEIDTLPLAKKRGANNELAYLGQLKNKGELFLFPMHLDLTKTDIEKDKSDAKIVDTIAFENNAILITQDRNQATNAVVKGVFSIHIIHSIEQVK